MVLVEINRFGRFLALLSVLCLAAMGEAVAVELHERVTLNGYSSFEYEYQVSDRSKGEGDKNGSFDADLFDLVLNIQATDRLRVSTDLTWEHGSATEDNRGNVGVEYAIAEYAFSDLFRVAVGKQFTHFGIYNEIHTAKPATLTVKEPQSTNKNHKFGSDVRFYPRWGVGIAVSGDGMLAGKDFDYVLQFTNGESDVVNPYEEDDNKRKAFMGRVRGHPTDDLRVGFSLYSDKSGKGTELFSYGLQSEWTYGKYFLEFEFVGGFVDPNDSKRIDRYSMTGLVAYSLTERLTPYFRFEFLDPDTNVGSNAAALYIGGVNFELDKNLHLKFEINHTTSERNNSWFGGDDFTEFKAAVAVGF